MTRKSSHFHKGLMETALPLILLVSSCGLTANSKITHGKCLKQLLSR
jgi:hypothetical protein